MHIGRFFHRLRTAIARRHQHTGQMDRREGQGNEPRPFSQQDFIQNPLPPLETAKKLTLFAFAARSPHRGLHRVKIKSRISTLTTTNENRIVAIRLPRAMALRPRKGEAPKRKPCVHLLHTGGFDKAKWKCHLRISFQVPGYAGQGISRAAVAAQDKGAV